MRINSKHQDVIQAGLLRAEKALDENSFDEAIELLNTIVSLREEAKVKNRDLADAYYDLAIAYLSASKAYADSKKQDYLHKALSFNLLAKEIYLRTKSTADYQVCEELHSDLLQRLGINEISETTPIQKAAASTFTRIRYRDLLVQGKLVASCYVEESSLILKINEPWNSNKGFKAIRKMFGEIYRERPELRKKLGRASVKGQKVEMSILDEIQQQPSEYLQFIREQAVTSTKKRYLQSFDEKVQGVIKENGYVKLQLDPRLSSEEIYCLNVALYNRYLTSEKFKYFFNSPKKTHDTPRLTLREPALHLDEQEIKAILSEICSTKKKKVKNQAKTAVEHAETADVDINNPNSSKASEINVLDDEFLSSEQSSVFLPYYDMHAVEGARVEQIVPTWDDLGVEEWISYMGNSI